jgi:hypothetical protein
MIQKGFCSGSLEGIDPKTGKHYMILSVSGKIEEAKLIYKLVQKNLSEDCILASLELEHSYWAGRDDPRFVEGKNEDGTTYEGDSTNCAIPRMYQYLLNQGWIVNAMSLKWYGDTPNPFPRKEYNPKGTFMHPCPSCEANIKSIMG